MTAKARRFLTTLVNSATISEAIRTTGVAEATAYRWLRDEDFKAELRQARREALTAATPSSQQQLAPLWMCSLQS